MTSDPRKITIEAHLEGRDELSLSYILDSHSKIQELELKGVGSPELLKLLVEWRCKLNGSNIESLNLPSGKSLAHILLRELILKLKGQWDYPYKEEELCHCRHISTNEVDQSIMTGAHTPKMVSQMTSASTACGTCRPNVQRMIKYRLKNQCEN